MMRCKSTQVVMHPRHVLAGLGFILLGVTGCQTVPPDAVAQFSQGTAKTQQQLDAAFHDANALARDEEITYVVSTTRPGLTEEDFMPALGADSVAAWDDAFAKIQAYATALQKLLSSDQTTQFQQSVDGLATELKTGSTGQKIDPSVAAAFTELGSVLIDVKAQKDAQAAMKKADSAIHTTLTQMADAIGETDKSVGVRSTVWANWEAKLAQGPVHDYSEAVKNGNNLDQKASAAKAYVAMLNERDAQLATLSSLRQSLLLLAAAHTAAANGSTTDAAGLIAIIGKHVDESQALLTQFKSIETDKTAAKGK